MMKGLESRYRSYVLWKLYDKLSMYYLRKRAEYINDLSTKKYWYYDRKYRYWSKKFYNNIDAIRILTDE